MTATSVARFTKSSGVVPAKGTLGVAANVLILKGTLVSVDSNGDADVITNGQDICGVACSNYDNRTTSRYSDGLARSINAEVDFGEFEFPYTGTAPEMGQVLFAVDNQTVGVDSNGGVRGVAGYAVSGAITDPDTGATTVRVYIGPHVSAAYADVSAVEAVATAASTKVDNLAVVEIPCPLGSFRLASGAAIPAFSAGSADGFELTASEALSLRINDDSTTVFWTSVKLPDDLDTNEAVEVHFLAARVGSADTTAAITVTAFLQDNGAAYDASSDLSSGNTGAIDGATKVSKDVSVTITGATAGCVLSISAKCTAALDDDDMVIHACWVKCTRTGA